MNELDKTLQDRGNTYGDFTDHARTTQLLKAVVKDALDKNPNVGRVHGDKRNVLNEGLEMILHKIGRIVNGDPTYADSWLDIEGYARITRERICKGETE